MRLPIDLFSLVFVSLAIHPAGAVFVDEAYNLDYQHQLLGLAQPHTTFFHHPRPDDRASLLYTLSDVGVLGAVNPGTGAIVWRQYLAGNTNRTFGGENGIQGFLRPSPGAVVSAVGGYVNAWDALTGREKWYNDFEGWARDLEVLEDVSDQSLVDRDVLVLFEQKSGKSVLRRLSGGSGDVVWEFTGDSGDVPFQVSTNVQSVFVVSLHGARGGYNLKVTTLDPVSGQRVDEHTLSTKSDVHGTDDVLFVGANSAAPIIAWTDKALKSLKVNILGTKNVQSLGITSAGEDVQRAVVHAPHLIQSKPHFLVHAQSETAHWAEVYHIDIAAGTITEAYHLPKLPGKGAFSTSSVDANVYFTRTSMDEVIIVSSDSHAVLGRWPIQSPAGTGHVLHGVSEVVSKAADSYAVRSAVVTNEDNWVMVRNGLLAWSRMEGLSGIVAAAWAEIPQEEDLTKNLVEEAHINPVSAYVHRVSRHVNDLQYLPEFLASLPQRFMKSIIPGESVTSDEPLARDNFGFRKLVIMATERGRVYALDSGSQGKIVWSARAFDIPAGEKWGVIGIFADPAHGLTTIKGNEGDSIVIKTVDGSIIETVPRKSWPSIQSAALVETSSGPSLLTVGLGGTLAALPAHQAPNGSLVVRGEDGTVRGVIFKTQGEEAIPVISWSFQPAKGERILSVTSRPGHDPVASIGKAMSDRTVMYKYLNPNTVLVTTVSDVSATATFYLLDSVSGDVLHATTHENVDVTQPITAVISENWFVYSFFGDLLAGSTLPSTKGYQLIVSEMYESSLTNDRGPLGNTANFSSLNPSSEASDQPPLPHVDTAAFIIPEAISHMSVSSTLQGITSRTLLCALPVSNAIIAIPRYILDPRRPVGRAPVAGEMEEGLSQYQPFIEFEPDWIVTHRRDVVGVQGMITSPALIESTSLVFAYGVDIFGTRVMPSMAFDVLGKGFNKLSLILTVLGLVVAVAVLAPMVRRKQIDARWKMG
ncbi:MAG: hypothetical protein M1818_007697 [Claussenomyces sp. TS43310]|nr:MAG: hypothetical protein M1818_007697 [Claussenomyces sp. TS43310]